MSFKNEILTVKNLGKQIGYGNMMNICSCLWAMDLRKGNGPESGAFYPAIGIDLKEERLAIYKDERKKYISEIENQLKNIYERTGDI